jgi:hypothetical protein
MMDLRDKIEMMLISKHPCNEIDPQIVANDVVELLTVEGIVLKEIRNGADEASEGRD